MVLSTKIRYTVQLINKIETDDSYIHISKGELGISLMPHIQLKKQCLIQPVILKTYLLVIIMAMVISS